MIQVRDVPENLHRLLKARAAQEGMSLSDFIKRELEHTMAKPSLREWLDMVGRTKPVHSKRSGVEIMRELRDSR